MIGYIQSLFYSNRRWLLIAGLGIAALVIAGCTSGAAPPAGPIGGGCG